jgi:acetoacetate decarboxylase
VTDTFSIAGRTITMPVEVRAAKNWIAAYSVDADRVRTLVEPTGLEVAEARPGKSLVTIGFVEYSDTDLGAYHEFMVGIAVRRHDAAPATARERAREVRQNRAGVYIHHLPVDDGFSMDAGRGIWGYPKTMMAFERLEGGVTTGWRLRDGGTPVVTMRWSPRWFPMPRSAVPPTYTLLDGVLRMTPWESHPRRTWARPGGVSLELGEGPIADDLRSIGLPKRALLAISVGEMRARFGSPQVIERHEESGSSEKESQPST